MKVMPFHRQRPLVCAACLFAAGIWTGRQGFVPVWLFAAALFLSVLFAWAGRKRAFGMLAGALGAAFFFGAVYISALDARPLPDEGTYTVTAYVSGNVEIREEDGFVHTFLRDARGVDENGNAVRLGKLYWVMTAEDEDLALARHLEDGARVTFRGKVTRPLGRMNPYGYDFRAYLEQNGVRMRVSGMTDLMVTRDARLDYFGVMHRIRSWIGTRMDLIFGEGAAFPRALLLGDKDQLPDETRDMFADLGIAHVLTVSGLHVALLSSVVMALLKVLCLSPRERMAVQGVLLLFYCALLEFSVPVVRASLLMVLSAYRSVVRRYGDTLTSLAFVFMLVLLCWPASLFSLSFQMTFGAVLGMVMLGPVFARWTEKWPRVLRALHPGVAASATLGVMLPLFNAYHRFSLIGLIVSPVAVLLTGILLPLLLAITAIGMVYLPLGQWLSGVLGIFARRVPEMMEKLANLPYAAVNVPAVAWPLALAFIYILFLCTPYTALDIRKRLAAGGAALLSALCVFVLTHTWDVCYIQLYQGQADCAVVLDRKETVVIDTGTNGGDLADLLLAKGRQADTVILTHLHSDHAGGIAELLESHVKIGRVLIPRLGETQQIDVEGMEALALLREAGIPVIEVSAGDSLTLPSGRITFVWPTLPRGGQDPNCYCLCALMELEGVRFLLTGDLVGAMEGYIAQEADILKVAHHGSADSTEDAFLQSVRPDIALIPCAAGRYLPSEDTLARLENSGAHILRTDETGAVTITLRNGEYRVNPYLDQRK